MGKIIEMSNITKLFTSQRVLDGVNLSVREGEYIVITGPSGSGKTTLINIIALLDSANDGTYELCGQNTTTMTLDQKNCCRRENMNIVFQKYNLFEELTVYENLELYARFCSNISFGLRDIICGLVQSLQLDSQLYKKVCFLSQGEKQRVAIARSLLSEKKLLLADEPSASVDRLNRDIILQQLERANRNGITVVVATHDREYLKYATRHLELSYGKLTDNSEMGV